jgi:hypothetical protein
MQILKDLSGDLKQFQTGLANFFLQVRSGVLVRNFSIAIPLHLKQEHESCESSATWESIFKLLRYSGKMQPTMLQLSEA